MAGFIDEILSGKYPQLKNIFERKFGEVVDSLLGDPLANLADPENENCDNERCKLKLESAMREIALLKADKTEADYRINVVKAERDALQKKLATIRNSLGEI